MAKKTDGKSVSANLRRELEEYGPHDISDMVQTAFGKTIEHNNYHMVESHCVDVLHVDQKEGYVFCRYPKGHRNNMRLLMNQLRERVGACYPGSTITQKVLPSQSLYGVYWERK